MLMFLVTKRCRKADIPYTNGNGGSNGYLTEAGEKECMGKHKKFVVIMGIPKWIRREYTK